MMAAQVLALVALALVEVAVSVALALELTHFPSEVEVEAIVEPYLPYAGGALALLALGAVALEAVV